MNNNHIKSPIITDISPQKAIIKNNLFKEISKVVKTSIFTGFSFVFLGLNINPIYAQINSDNTTNTIVNQNNNQFDITGGILSQDGTNLFHSFSQFGLTSNQIANFLANPNLHNILGRITGGDPSYINGLIQVTNGNSNLFLMNPAGIIFGNNTILNVPADFTATTATGIMFGDQYFKAIGDNNYANLIGNPTGFIFNTNNPGSIINTGDLTVNENNNLSLIGGTVISTGNLTANNGNINIVTVPESSKIILSQPGQILSLEINIPSSELGNSLNITPLDLPELLTGSQGIIETQGIEINSSENVALTSSGTIIETGDIVLNQANTNNIYVNADQNLTLIESQLNATNNLNLLAKDTVYIRDSLTNPVLIRSGNNLYIQGNNGIDILALNHLETTPFVSGGNLTFVSDGIISGDAHYTSGGNISFLNLLGSAGEFYSYYDPIISANGDVTFGDYTGASLKVEATGSITAGNIIINAKDDAIDPDNYVLILQAGVTSLTETNFGTPPTDINISTPATTPSTVTVGNIDVGKVDGEGTNYYGGIVTITATGDITTGNINTSNTNPFNTSNEGRNVTITSTGGNITTGDINTSAYTNANNESDITAIGGDINITTTQGSIVTGNLNTSAIASTSFSRYQVSAQGGSVILTSGSIAPHNSITFKSIDTRGITIDSVTATSTLSPLILAGGDVTVTASGGTVRGTGTILDKTILNGTITLSGNNSTINTSAINIIYNTLNNTESDTNTNNGGSINITHDGGNTNAPFIIGDSSINGTAGNITDGTNTFSSGSFAVQANGGTDTIGNIINITSVNTPPTLTANNNLGTILQGNSLNINYSNLNPIISDINVDNTSLIIESILTGGILKINGIIANIGDIIPVGATMEFIPPSSATGEIIAFTIKASDQVSFSDSININLTIETPVIPPVIPPDIEETVLIGKNPIINIINNTNIAQNSIPIVSLDQAQTKLTEIEQATGVKPALIYVTFSPSLTSGSQVKQQEKIPQLNTNLTEENNTNINNRFNTVETTNTSEFQNYLNLPEDSSDINIKVQPQNTDELELILVMPGKPPIRKRIAGITRYEVIDMGKEFQASVTSYRRPRNFLEPAQQLYQWFIAPLETSLKQEEIQNLAFIMDPGVRSLPLAALHDGEQYLVENYSVGLMPSISLSDTRYVDIRNLQVLAMGAQTFTDHNPLPSVPVELSFIEQLWGGQAFLDEEFTESNLKKARTNNPYSILHLATHGEFLPGDITNSYIQFSNEKLTLDQFRTLGLNNPPVELMVLSACRTALGDEDAELGFAGLALQAGVKTALGSLWYVSDEGTLALMSNFYQQLKTAPIKAEALRQAQLAMIRGEVRLENGALTGTGLRGSVSSENEMSTDFTHPYYWSAFTMIGNPW